jgi:hypothetical protein
MRPALLLFVSPAALLLSAWAAQADCLSIHDNDTRHECSAREQRDPTICNSIADFNRRQICFAEQRRDPDACTSVLDANARELCRQRAGQRQ